MASTDRKVLGIDELSVYDALIKHYINLQYPSVSGNQIDDLFPQEPNVPDPIPTVELASWSTGTDEEITAIINGYYNGTISLSDIQKAWHVGDVRNISISGISAYSNDADAYAAQTLPIQILDFEHDNLTTSINGKTKALITVDFKNRLGTKITNYGKMNSENFSVNSWGDCFRRRWCNDDFYNALPEYIKSLVKTVDKETNVYKNAGLETTSDLIFFLSENEVNGTINRSAIAEGNQYYYYSLAPENKYKEPKDRDPSDSITSSYWLRTLAHSTSNASCFCYISAYGAVLYSSPGNYGYMAPAFCL